MIRLREWGKGVLVVLALAGLASLLAGRSGAAVPPGSRPTSSPSAGELVPFVMPPDIAPGSVVAFHGRAIAPDASRVTVSDGHFRVGDSRLRIWGVNICQGACFPSHTDAERMASRLEAFGVNSVRLHQFDIEWFTYPRSIWDSQHPEEFSADAMERMDYFIDQLARHGIYVNMNLHVSRIHSRHLGLPDTKATGPYDKIVDLFMPELMAAEEAYARKLLDHVNPYRGKRYADDPAIAFVEINNENSFFMPESDTRMPAMAPVYSQVLTKMYNQWLLHRYPSRERLAAAWDSRQSGANPPPAPQAMERGWKLTVAAGAKGSAVPSSEARATRIEIAEAGTAAWNAEYCQNDLHIARAYAYKLSFRAKADAPRGVTVSVRQSESPWSSLGLRQNVQFGKEWKNYEFEFVSPRDEQKARLGFLCGQAAIPYEVADVRLEAAWPSGLLAEEDPQAGTVALFGKGESTERKVTRLRFLAETEKTYYDGMYRLLRQQMGCQALITGTIAYGYLGLWAQSGMDYIDTHTYWSHPQFPGGQWNASNWFVSQVSVADDLMLHSLIQQTALRLAGKPFTVSEYNHPAPNDYQAETVPTIATLAAAQDWDGVWLFAYNADSAPGTSAFNGFFDIAGNPAKWAFMPVGAALFREGAFQPLAEGTTYSLSTGADSLDALTHLQLRHGSSTLDAVRDRRKLDWQIVLQRRLAVSFDGEDKSMPTIVGTPTTIQFSPGQLTAQGYGGLVIMQSSKAATGSSLPAGKAGTVAAASLDGKSLTQCDRALVVACGRCENSDMGFSRDHRSVGTRWGTSPVTVEPLDANLAWPGTKEMRLRSLDASACPAADVPLETNAAGLHLPLSRKWQTVWYYLTDSNRLEPSR